MSVRCGFIETLTDELFEAGVFTCKSVTPAPTTLGSNGCTVACVSLMRLLGLFYSVKDCFGDGHFDGSPPCSDDLDEDLLTMKFVLGMLIACPTNLSSSVLCGLALMAGFL